MSSGVNNFSIKIDIHSYYDGKDVMSVFKKLDIIEMINQIKKLSDF